MLANAVFEEILLNQWQPLQTMLYDGWVLRFANGYTKRANSINPIYFSNEDVHNKIEECEKIYTLHQLKTVFKITPFVHPANLDEILAKEGYVVVDHTSVQGVDLRQIREPSEHRANIDSSVNDEWLAHFCTLNNVGENHKQTMQRMLDNQLTDKGFFSLYNDNEVVACGVGMLERNYLGIFDVVTSLNHRNQGFGEQLLLHILQWGRQHGAKSSYLAVLLNNQPALKLYAKLGFREIYRYWYRVK